MMLTAILAASILGSIPSAVERTLQDPPLELISRAEFNIWTARVIRSEEIRDETIGCTVESLIGTGGDLFTTGWAWDRCSTCKESNVLGINADARAGLKFAQTGADLALCLFQAKNRKNMGEAGTKTSAARWLSRGLRIVIIFNNGFAVVTGKPLIKLGQ